MIRGLLRAQKGEAQIRQRVTLSDRSLHLSHVQTLNLGEDSGLISYVIKCNINSLGFSGKIELLSGNLMLSVKFGLIKHRQLFHLILNRRYK